MSYRSPPPKVASDDWSYDGKLRYKDVPRRDACQLRKLLFPEDHNPSENKVEYVNVGEWEPPDELNKKFAVAQLSHYGLPFAKSATGARAIKLLTESLLAGKVGLVDIFTVACIDMHPPCQLMC